MATPPDKPKREYFTTREEYVSAIDAWIRACGEVDRAQVDNEQLWNSIVCKWGVAMKILAA